MWPLPPQDKLLQFGISYYNISHKIKHIAFEATSAKLHFGGSHESDYIYFNLMRLSCNYGAIWHVQDESLVQNITYYNL